MWKAGSFHKRKDIIGIKCNNLRAKKAVKQEEPLMTYCRDSKQHERVKKKTWPAWFGQKKNKKMAKVTWHDRHE